MEDAVYQKLNQIREVMARCREITKGKKSSQPRPVHNVAIISALEEEEVRWFLTAIGSAHFQEEVAGLKLLNITKVKEKNWDKLMAEYTFCFYVSSEEEWRQGKALTQRVKSLSAHGQKDLLVVTDGAAGCSSEERTRILAQHPAINKYCRGLFLFSGMEKESLSQRFSYNFPQPGPDSLRRGSRALSSSKVVIGIRHKVGIFSRSADSDFSWLMTLLRSEAFKDHVLSVRPCFISNNGRQKLDEDLAHCTFGILYHTKNKGSVNVTDGTDSLYDEELQHLAVTLEKKNVLVVIDDLEESGEQQKSRLLHSQPKIAAHANNLILISHQDKTDHMGQAAEAKILANFLRPAGERLENPAANENQRGSVSYPSLERSHSPPYMAPPELPASSKGHVPPAPSKSTIGIFSRSEEGDYLWLRELLTSEDFGHKDVLCYKISGNDDEALRAAAFKSRFGILYHSMKNGKIRLTDVKDSLYHEELEQLSAKLGKRKMFVVIDDMDDGGDKMKQKILKKQPSLGRLATEVFLFTTSEKKDVYHESQGKHKSKMSKSTRDKISSLKKVLT